MINNYYDNIIQSKVPMEWSGISCGSLLAPQRFYGGKRSGLRIFTILSY